LLGLAAISAAMVGLPHSRILMRRSASSTATNAGSAARHGEISPPKSAFALAAFEKLPLSFEANHGQADPRVRFLARSRDFALFILPGEALLAARTTAAAKPQKGARISGGAARISAAGPANILHVKFAGANPNASVEGVNLLPGRSNYFIGNDPGKWRTGIPTFAQVHVTGIYPGIDLVYYGRNGQLEFDVIVHPGADPHRVLLDFDGCPRPVFRADGSMALGQAGSEYVLHPPRVFQQTEGRQREIAAAYFPSGTHGAEIRLAPYDSSRDLVMDPTLTFGTYLGGRFMDQGLAVALDGSGNAYITGSTMGGFPVTTNPFEGTIYPSALQNAFVTEIGGNPPKLIYSTYLGGNDSDQGSAIAVDSAGNAYITGSTTSSAFPTFNPIQPALAGVQNAFITELNSSGSALIYSTFFGGSKQDLGAGIALDSATDAYITGMTNSTNFPTANAYQRSLGSGATENAFASKIAAGGTAIDFSTYLGGTNNDYAAAIALDSSGDAYVTGTATSTDFPVSSGAYQTAPGGDGDAFVTKFSSAGARDFSTFLGGSGTDQGFGIAVGSGGVAYIAGGTSSTNFPTTQNAAQPQLAGVPNAFMTEMNSTGTALVYSTFLGGSGGDQAFAIALDSSFNSYITGQTRSANFPIISAIQGALVGTANSFIAEFATGGSLTFSTYYGGNGIDSGNSIAVDSSGNISVAGSTTSSNLVVSPNVQPAYGGDGDVFYIKMSPAPSPTATFNPISVDFGTWDQFEKSTPMTVTVTNYGGATLNISGITITGANTGDFAETNNCGSSVAVGAKCTVTATFTPQEGGSRAANLQFADNAAGNPQIVVLSGVGLGAIPEVSLVPEDVNFPNGTVGTPSSPESVSLVNNGTGPLTVTKVQIAGDNKKDFSETNSCSVVNAGASCPISVTFTPTVAGPRQAILEVTDNATNSPQSAILTGGGNFALSAAPTTEVVNPGQSTSYIITATPLNMFNQAITFSCLKPPAGVTCTFSPATLTLNGTNAASTTLTVTTNSNVFPLSIRHVPGALPFPVLLIVGLGILCGSIILLRRRPVYLAIAAVLMVSVLAPGCGGSKSTTASTGAYMIAVQGTFGTFVQSTTIVLDIN
jgi:hypothetical protein